MEDTQAKRGIRLPIALVVGSTLGSGMAASGAGMRRMVAHTPMP